LKNNGINIFCKYFAPHVEKSLEARIFTQAVYKTITSMRAALFRNNRKINYMHAVFFRYTLSGNFLSKKIENP